MNVNVPGTTLKRHLFASLWMTAALAAAAPPASPYRTGDGGCTWRKVLSAASIP